jgi:hypothetical protein
MSESVGTFLRCGLSRSSKRLAPVCSASPFRITAPQAFPGHKVSDACCWQVSWLADQGGPIDLPGVMPVVIIIFR